MYGRYSRSLGDYAREQAAELRALEKTRKREEKMRSKELRTYRGKWTSRFLRLVSFIWRHTFAKIGEDWVFLALLGIIMAVLSYIMDYGISMCNTGMYNATKYGYHSKLISLNSPVPDSSSLALPRSSGSPCTSIFSMD